MASVVRGAAIVHLVGLRLGLRLRLARAPLDVVVGRLGRRVPRGLWRLSRSELERAMEAGELLADRLPGIGRSCLYRALARYALFRSRGYSASFVIGIDSARPDLAHAWVELDGRPFREEGAAEYLVSFRFPPASP
jgi:hypothetical protein